SHLFRSRLPRARIAFESKIAVRSWGPCTRGAVLGSVVGSALMKALSSAGRVRSNVASVAATGDMLSTPDPPATVALSEAGGLPPGLGARPSAPAPRRTPEPDPPAHPVGTALPSIPPLDAEPS